MRIRNVKHSHQKQVPANIPVTKTMPAIILGISAMLNIENANTKVIIVAGLVMAIKKDDVKNDANFPVLAASLI